MGVAFLLSRPPLSQNPGYAPVYHANTHCFKRPLGPSSLLGHHSPLAVALRRDPLLVYLTGHFLKIDIGLYSLPTSSSTSCTLLSLLYALSTINKFSVSVLIVCQSGFWSGALFRTLKAENPIFNLLCMLVQHVC